MEILDHGCNVVCREAEDELHDILAQSGGLRIPLVVEGATLAGDYEAEEAAGAHFEYWGKGELW